MATELPDESFYFCNAEGEERPSSEVPESIVSLLRTTELLIGYRRRAEPSLNREVGFEEWELLHIYKGNLPVPYWMMEEARAEEKFGLNTDEFMANCEERLNKIIGDHVAWGLIQYYNLWPNTNRPHESWFKRYEQLKAEGYGDNWYAFDYSTLPELDPHTLFLPEPEEKKSKLARLFRRFK